MRFLSGLSPLAKAMSGVVTFIAAVVGILLALGLLGSETDALGAAVKKTINAGSSAVTFDMTGEGVAALAFSGEGEMDYRRGHGRMTYDYSEMGGPAGIEAIVSGTTLYLRAPDPSLIPPGKSWVRYTLSDLLGADSASTNIGLLPLGQDDPSRLLEMLEATGNAEKVGNETLFGGTTTRYHGEVDPDEFVEYASSQGTMSEENARKLVEDVRGSIPFDIWIDDDGLVRREKITLTSVVEGQMETISATIDLYDFGIPVNAEPPPAEQVVDASEVQSSIG